MRVAVGDDDPCFPGDQALGSALGSHADVDFTSGCHTQAFAQRQLAVSLGFLARGFAR